MTKLQKIRMLELECKQATSYVQQLQLNFKLMCALLSIVAVPFLFIVMCVFAFRVLSELYTAETVFVSMLALFLPLGFFVMSYIDYMHNKKVKF